MNGQAQALVWTRSPVARRLISEAPYLPRCSDNKTAAIVRPVHYAIRYPYMQVNRPGMVSWMIFDLDHSNANIWDDEGLPAPNFIVRNRKNGHAHLYYAIVPVCTTEAARSHPQQYMKAVYQAFCLRLNADASYSGPVAKTPFHPWWDTTEIHDRTFELGELADFVELPSRNWNSGPDLNAVAHSRHCTLFEELRYYAYSIVTRMRDTSTYERFCRDLDAFAHNRNNFRLRGFTTNLSLSQVKATVRSVSRWTWDIYRGSSVHRGVMQLDSDLPLAERQKRAAVRTHQERRAGTASKIRAAVSGLREKGLKITFKAIGEFARLSRQTVATYRETINEVIQGVSSVAYLRSAAGQHKNVKHAVHQIPALSAGLVSETDGLIRCVDDVARDKCFKSESAGVVDNEDSS